MNAPAFRAPMVNATRFRAAHEEDWARLEELVTIMEKRSLRRLSDDDLLALPGLYRTTLSSLSVARDTSLDRGLITYLEQLCTRAYFQIYDVQTPASRQFRRFFGCSVGGYIRQLQFREVASLLTDRQSGLAQIAYRVGFSDQAHLTRAFVRELGITPGQFRRLMR